MPAYRCAYCHRNLGTNAASRCPHCGKVMLGGNPGDTGDVPRRKRGASRRAGRGGVRPGFRPGRSPALLGGAILVLLILGSLLTLRIQTPRSETSIQIDREAQARREVDTLAAALQRFRRDTGRYPSEAEGLVALVQDPGVPGWDGHYVTLIQPDPWKTPYRYTRKPDEPEVRSAGPDRIFGTAQDIYSIPLLAAPKKSALPPTATTP